MEAFFTFFPPFTHADGWFVASAIMIVALLTRHLAHKDLQRGSVQAYAATAVLAGFMAFISMAVVMVGYRYGQAGGPGIYSGLAVLWAMAGVINFWRHINGKEPMF